MTPRLQQLKSHLVALREFGVLDALGYALLHGHAPALDLIRQAHVMCRNGLFDRQWYAVTYPDVPKKKALFHFLLSGCREGRSPGPGFDSAYYLDSNPDVALARMNPALHFELFGREEGRLPLPAEVDANPPRESHACGEEIWFPARLADAVTFFHANAGAAQAALDLHPPHAWLPALREKDAVEVFIHSSSNIFMCEIAELVSAAFTAAGFSSTLCDEQSALDASGRHEPALRLVVAPHEFFLLPGKRGGIVPADWARGAVLLNVEQLHTEWFQTGLQALKHARGVFDINLQSAAVLAQAGLPAAFLPLGFVPGFSAFRPPSQLPGVPALATLERGIRESAPPLEAPLSERPIDIFFIGHLSPRREGILERMAERLARWRCHFVLTASDIPLVRGQNAVLDTEATLGLVQRSKIVLNIHQSDEPFFEWHRIVLQGIWQRALVITEPVTDQTLFIGGEHFLSAPLDELADMLDWVLGTAEGMATADRVRSQAHEQFTEGVRFDKTLKKLFAVPASECSGKPDRDATRLAASP